MGDTSGSLDTAQKHAGASSGSDSFAGGGLSCFEQAPLAADDAAEDGSAAQRGGPLANKENMNAERQSQDNNSTALKAPAPEEAPPMPKARPRKDRGHSGTDPRRRAPSATDELPDAEQAAAETAAPA